MTLASRRILLIVGGGIAAYKSLDLIRRLRERGAKVRCVMTQAAQHFVTPAGSAIETGPDTSRTSAPSFASAAAMAWPCLPDERLAM